MTEVDNRSSPAVYFDGVTSARHEATVTCTHAGLAIQNVDGSAVAEWPYVRLKHLNAPAHVLRIGLRKSKSLERLEIVDRELAHDIDAACPDIDRSGASARAGRRRAIALSFAAAVSLLLIALYGIPEIAARLSRITPQAVDERLGNAADLNFRTLFDKSPKDRPFECGGAAIEAEGKAAFVKLMSRLQEGAALDIPVRAVVVRRDEPNAFALAGGHIYVLQGLIDKATHVDELAAVIAHELGHVANRDGVRSLIQAAGLSLVFGVLLGDFVGGGAVVVAGKLLTKAAYSRHKETAADDYAVQTMQALNADPHALGTFLARVARSSERGSIFLAHPAIPDRLARMQARAPKHIGGAQLLDAAEWAALKRICSGHP